MFLFSFGICCILTPILYISVNTKNQDNSSIEWVSRLSPSQYGLIQGFIFSGFLFMLAGCL